MERIELRPRPWRLAGLTAMAIGFVALGILFLVFPYAFSRYPAFWIRCLGALTLLFFGACAVAGVFQIRDRQPRVVLSDEGLFVPALHTPLIPWRSILSVSLITIHHSRFLSLTLADDEQRIAALSSTRRAAVTVNRGLGFGAFNIGLTALGVPAEWLLQQIEQRVVAFGNPLPPL